MITVIALVAEKGAGKGLCIETAKRLLTPKTTASVRFSDPLVDILSILDKDPSRQNIQTLATAIRAAFHDEGILNAAIKKRIKSAKADIIFLDGLRKKEEVDLIKQYGGLLLYITADQRTRYERTRVRPEKTDEYGISWEKFLKQDKAAPEASIRAIGETMADAVIDNNGTAEILEEKIKSFLQEHRFI